MPDPSPLWPQIERRMSLLGLNPNALDKKAGLRRGTIADLKYGRSRHPRSDTLRKIVSALGCTEADLDPSLRQERTTTASRRMARSEILIRELDVRAGAGDCMEPEDQEVSVAEWAVPENIIRGQTTAPPQGLAIITVYGDSMVPDFRPGERIMVDTSDRRPSPPGVFVLWDGFGLVVKRLEMIPYSDPPVVSLISRNEQYAKRQLPADDVDIKGRVIGKWQWT